MSARNPARVARRAPRRRLVRRCPRRAQRRHAPAPNEKNPASFGVGFDGHASRRGRRSLRRRERLASVRIRERVAERAPFDLQTGDRSPCLAALNARARRRNAQPISSRKAWAELIHAERILEPARSSRGARATTQQGQRALTRYFALHCMLHIRSPGAQPHALFLGFGAAGAAAAGVSAAAALPPPDFFGATPPPPAGR